MATQTTTTTDKDIDYIQKDFYSSLDAMITFANVNYGPGTTANRLWTNFNADSFSRNWLEIVAFIADVFFFYFDNQATQTYLQTANLRSAVNDIAKQFGFTPATAQSASGVATFTTTGATTIPRGFKVRSSTGEDFFLTSNIVAGAAGSYSGTVLQGEIVNESFVSSGVQNEEFDLTGPNVIVDLSNLNPADVTPQVSVNGNSYSLVSSFIRYSGTDLPGSSDLAGSITAVGGRVFTIGERSDGTPFIRFGDGIFGRKLQPGETVNVVYRSGGGSAGNIPKESLTTLVDSLVSVSSVINNADFSGGADEQTIEQLRDLIPASLRTLDRAVSKEDYADLLKSAFTEVFAASAEASEQVGIDINVYVVPQGIGISKISDNPLLKTRLANFLDRRKMVTTQFEILDAFAVEVLVSLEVFITNTASKSTVKQAIETAITDYFSLTTGGSLGSGVTFAEPILLKDIANLIEVIDGVERFEIKRLTYRPRVVEEVVGLTADYNSSAVSVFPAVEEREWLLVASGELSKTASAVTFSNPSATGYTYNSSTGIITYALPVDLELVAPGQVFIDGASAEFVILGVDTKAYTIQLEPGETVNTSSGGTTRQGDGITVEPTKFESFKCYRKINAETTNLGVDSLTDNNLDLSVLSSQGAAISSREILDNSAVFVPNEYAAGQHYLVDASSNVWQIVSNTNNIIKTSVAAVNDGAITSVAGGAYKIVKKLQNQQVLFNSSVFTIDYNTNNTVFSLGAQFSEIGTIGDAFQIAKLQTNKGVLGVAVDLIDYDATTKQVKLNNEPDLSGVDSTYVLLDKDGQVLNISALDNRSLPIEQYEVGNKNAQVTLAPSGAGAQFAQGFQVPETTTYSVVDLYLKRSGNILGNLTLKILADDSGLPDIVAPAVAISNPISLISLGAEAKANLQDQTFELVSFTFTTPPTLTTGVQYHAVLSHDAAYTSSYISTTDIVPNSGSVTFNYNIVSGLVTYSAPGINLTSVVPGDFIRDKAGDLYEIFDVNDALDYVEIGPGKSSFQDGTPGGPTPQEQGAIVRQHFLEIGYDSSPSYASGDGSTFNDVLGIWSSFAGDFIFAVKGARSISVNSDLVPALGPGATISKRYYDDENQISLVIGLSDGIVTSAIDANAYGKGTIGAEANKDLDRFTFKTSRYADDIVNIRNNEIPQISVSDITTTIFGGVE